LCTTARFIVDWQLWVNCTHYCTAALLSASAQLAESIRAAKRFRVVPIPVIGERYSIASTARASSGSGTVMPSAVAVLENSSWRRIYFIAFQGRPFAVNEPRWSNCYSVFRPVALKPLPKYGFVLLESDRIVRSHEHEKSFANLLPPPVPLQTDRDPLPLLPSGRAHRMDGAISGPIPESSLQSSSTEWKAR
jgi:hypothetical protein